MMRRILPLLAFVLTAVPATASAEIKITPDSRTEGEQFVFKVTRTSVLETASYTTKDGSAKAGSDYDAASGQINFGVGMTADITVQSRKDDAPEIDETFTVELSGGTTPAPIASATGTIRDDDVPTINLGDASVSEKDGKADLKLTTTPISRPITVRVTTSDGSANASDYEARNATVEIKPGDASTIVSIPVKNDDVDEEDESFSVKLSDAVGAKIGDGEAMVAIANDDLPLIGIGDIGVMEGDGTVARFPVQLSAATFRTVTVAFVTVDGSAKAPRDYLARTGFITFLPGQKLQFIDVGIASDDAVEPNEFFGVLIGQPNGGRILKGSAVAAVRDDDVGGRAGADRESPKMLLSKPRLSGSRAIRSRVTCPNGERQCKGRLVLYGRVGTAERRIGSKTFTLPGNAARTLTISIPTAILSRARKDGRLPLRAYMVTSDAADNVDTKEMAATLKFKKTAKKKKKSSSAD